MATLTVFEAGYCTHLACMAQQGAGWRTCRFPARAWLLEAGKRRWLWDTGYAAHFIDCTRRGLFQIYRRVTPVYFDPREALVAQLAQRGITPADLSGVILSHFHGDHIAGLRDFPAMPLICCGEGWRRTRHLRGFSALRQAFVPGLIPEDFETRLLPMQGLAPIALPATLQPFTQGYLLPDSQGEIILLPLPGHAAGHIGAFVQTAEGWILLAGDAAWTPANYRQLRYPSRLANLLMDDASAYRRTLQQLQQLDMSGMAAIRLCHEGDI